MSAAHHRPAPAPAPDPPPAPAADPETVYLRACPGGRWSVHLGPRLILVTDAEDDAFHAACTAARRDSPPARPMLLVSGPSALHAGFANSEA